MNNVKRPLRLASPHMRGNDVKELQRSINARLRSRGGRKLIEVDGEYGRDTARAVRRVGVLLGVREDTLEHGATVGVQRVIVNPATRTPAQLKRARDRRKAEEARGRGIDAALRWAVSQIGTVEHPASSNRGPKIDDWEKNAGMGAGPWCGAFAKATCGHGGVVLTPEVRYCPSTEAHARVGTGGLTRWITNPRQAARGDLALFDWERNGVTDHVGVVESINVDAWTLTCIEGNTSPTDAGSQGNGGGVFRRTRSLNFVKGFARPDWA